MGPGSSAINLMILILPIILGSMLALISPVDLAADPLPWVVFGIGFLTFLISKVATAVRTKNLVDFGAKSMTHNMKIAYFSGYALMLVALLLQIFL